MKDNPKTKKIGYRDFPPSMLRIRPSKLIAGEVGVFAVRNLKKGTVIGRSEMLGEDFFLSKEDYRKLDAKTRETVKDFCGVDELGYYVPADINYLSILWHLNHSCDANVGFDDQGNFVTIRNVRSGEEVALDCGMLMSDPHFRLKCRCGSANCRKVVTGNDWKNEEYARKHFDHMMPELRANVLNAKGKIHSPRLN